MGQKGNMNAKQKVGCFFAILSILVTSPIWYYLLYQILKAVNASDVMWLLYWIYLPVGIVSAILKGVAKSVFDEKAG